jgi:hypothetical protein
MLHQDLMACRRPRDENFERESTDRITPSVIVDEEDGQLRIPPSIVRCCNDVAALESDSISRERT